MSSYASAAHPPGPQDLPLAPAERPSKQGSRLSTDSRCHGKRPARAMHSMHLLMQIAVTSQTDETLRRTLTGGAWWC